MFGSREGKKLLVQLFNEQYEQQGPLKLHKFLGDARGIELPFDLIDQMRRRDYPGFSGFEAGLPSSFYYFVPGSSYGGHQERPDDPLDPTFVAAADGIGLNFGCPLRLEQAIGVLLHLTKDDQSESRIGLATATKHLSTVEELIWAGIWRQPFAITRPTHSPGRKSHDWQIVFPEITINLECKFTPASWARLVDGNGFQLMAGALAKKASAQLPDLNPNSINVVAVTGIATADDGLRHLAWSDLSAYPRVQVIIYTDIVGQATVFSLSPTMARSVHDRIQPWPADRYRGFSSVVSFRPENARRANARNNHELCARPFVSPDLVELPVKCLAPKTIFLAPPPEYPYRFELMTRLETGEPIFKWIPPFIEMTR